MTKITKAQADAQAKREKFLQVEDLHHQNKKNRNFWAKECRMSEKAYADARRDYKSVEKYMR